ncbi:NAD+ synthase [Coprothermobacteraceae bacterium]|nr:NAD+ synthase [Coprothermobacteraceae bacterium]
MKIGLAQINSKVGDIRGNTAKILDAVNKLRQAEIVVFPELAITGYPPEDLLYDPDFLAAAREHVDKLLKELPPDQVVVFGAPVAYEGALYNCAIAAHGGRLVAVHRKVALPNYGVFDEKRYFTAGTKGTVIRFANASVGVVVCEDLWHEDSPVAWEAEEGASVIISINASPFELNKAVQRLEVLRKHATTLGVYIVYVNIVGGQDGLIFDGGSMVISPSGELLSALPFFEEAFHVIDLPNESAAEKQLTLGTSKCNVVDLELPLSEEQGQHEQVVLRYDEMEVLYKALSLALRDYVEKQGFPGVIVPISGGIDSALVATLAVDALGAQRVKLLYMPTRFNSPASLEDAKLVAENLKVPLDVIDIDGIFDSFSSALREHWAKTDFDAADENLQARIRANVAFYLSNHTGYLVLSCSNKSEAAVGYGTIYGDMAGGFAPLKDVLKTQVYALARYRNSISAVIPERVLSREPSAELRPNQKDQDVLPPYPILDAFLEDFVVNKVSRSELVRKYGRDITKKVMGMIKAAEFKRRQAPIGPKVSERCFGKDWRMPVVNGFAPDVESDDF